MEDPCQPVTARSADGALIAASPHGGQLLHWIPAGSDRDALWTSPLARCGPGQAIRGGIPVIFPQFSGRVLPGAAPLTKHGFARDRGWALAAGTEAGSARITARLEDDEQTRAGWPHRFELTLTATAQARLLLVRLEVRNADRQPIRFAAALHGYLRVRDAATATLHGLAGLTGQDNGTGATDRLQDGPLAALGPRDLALPGALAGARQGAELAVEEPDGYRIRLRADGFQDLVCWNPGPEHGLADVPAGGASEFVCLEPAQLDPVTLVPGETWVGSQTLEVDPGPAG